MTGKTLDLYRAALRDCPVRRRGLTTLRRPLAAAFARSGGLDSLMIDSKAAHLSAEHDVFPLSAAMGMALLDARAHRRGRFRPTPADLPGFVVPPSPAWSRFVRQRPSVSVALVASAIRINDR